MENSQTMIFNAHLPLRLSIQPLNAYLLPSFFVVVYFFLEACSNPQTGNKMTYRKKPKMLSCTNYQRSVSRAKSGQTWKVSSKGTRILMPTVACCYFPLLPGIGQLVTYDDELTV